MQESMAYFKFHGRREYGEFYGRMLGEGGAAVFKRWQPQVIIPVPVHRQKRRKRGYNQAEIVGQVLSKGLSIPIRTDLIERVKDTKAQKELNPKERRRNLTQAFRGKKAAGKYSRILLVDDIYTTGSTVDEVARELKKCGVRQVFFATVCIGSGF
jgi:ComF family protein